MFEPTTDVLPQACPACGTVVDVGGVEPLARVACPSCGEKFRVDRAFDHFELLETLGVGGMGAVYKARDTRLDRFVALKLLRKELSADPAEAARLEQEARLTAAVNHPNVVQVYSSGTAHGQIYLVMELVDHGSLDDLMAQHERVPEARVLATGIQVARGLQAAHERGLIHRDVKPGNILFGDEETAKIGDFGLAVAAGQNAEARNEIWGTPYYVAPERLNNEPEDFRSDLYSLGATLFHAAAGKPPMEGESTSAAELRELKSHPAELREVAPEVSAETSRVIGRMIAPDPADRFASYAELIDELRGAYRPFSGEPDVSALRRWWLIATIAALAVAAAAGVYVVRVRHATQTTIANVSHDSEAVAVLQRRYGEARQQLIMGNYDAAATSLAQLSVEAKGKQPLFDWIELHRGLAALLQNDASAARAAFQAVESASDSSQDKPGADLGPFFKETARALLADPPVKASAQINPNSADALALFLLAARNWQAAKYAEAVPLLERYSATNATGAFAWANDYKPVAQKLLADYKLYAEWKKQPHSFTTVSDIAAALKMLRASVRKLQTHGALADEMTAEVKRLSAEQKRMKKLEKADSAASSKALAEEGPAWAAALTEARRSIAVYDFSGASETIDAVDVSDPALRAAQTAELKRIEWLVAWKAKLIADLSTGRFAAPVTDIRGASYTGAAGASETGIALRIPPYGSAQVKWTDLAPKTLLAMSTSFILPTSGDAADREWLAAVFAQATGQTDAARTLGEAAAKTKPEYRDALRLLTAATQPPAR